ncbi:hypothetical protein Btru_045988 [Bulinus truncatus]|nr:hypothetical protein Btru_045988 [Bulinus truncatus]
METRKITTSDIKVDALEDVKEIQNSFNDKSSDPYENIDLIENVIPPTDESSDFQEIEVIEKTAELYPDNGLDGTNEKTSTNQIFKNVDDFSDPLVTNTDVDKKSIDDPRSRVLDDTVTMMQPNSAVEGCVLRHRLDPEPPRSTEDTDGYAQTLDDDSIPKGTREKNKIALIRKVLDTKPVDVAALRNLAISPGGLINKEMRQCVWPLLMNVNTENIFPKPSQEEMEAMSKTYTQVVMDVNRSSSRFPPGIDDHVRMSMKDKLVDLIMRVMLKNRQLKYYQGFHDVCITFLLCMDEDLAFALVDRLALGNMREYLDETMERTSLLLNYIYPLVNKCNPELCQHMERNDLGTIFALSWVITWFSHVLGDIKRIFRVFDFFLASHRLMPVYLSAAFVLYREQDIYAAGDEMGYIHKCLSTIPPDLPLESLLERAGDLYLQYPPTEISQDPMLIRMNKQVYNHFNRIDSHNASRRLAQRSSDMRSRMFVKMTMWTVTAVVGVAAAVLYHTYRGQDWAFVDIWGPFS